jgi:phage protein D
MTRLSDYSDQYGGFYAPGFVVAVDGRSLVEQLAIAVSQVEVDLKLGVAGHFSFTVIDTFDITKRAFISGYDQPVLEILKFGAKVDIKLGYGDHAHLTQMMTGIITEITTSFSEGGTPELSVSGYDSLFLLTLGKRSRSWKQQKDSDVVSLVAKDYNLATVIQTTGEQHAQVEQNQESDADLLKKLAERNYFKYYVDEQGTLHFAEPNNKAPGVVTLSWGESLLSFKPEANLAAQVSAVEVYGWDPNSKQAIVGKARAGEESGKDPSRNTGGQRIRRALNRDAVLQVRQPVFTQAEATRRAQAILDDHAKNFLTGDAECIGLPDLRPDMNITLGNLGAPFSKTYYLQEATHKVDGNGYRTTVKVQETSL